MPETLLLGYKGSGKSLFPQVVLRDSEVDIYSNMWMDHPKYHPLELHQILKLPRGVNIILDEGYTLIESRRSSSYLNLIGTYVAFQLRKTDSNIFVTAQDPSSLDKRYRSQWDYVVECMRVPSMFEIFEGEIIDSVDLNNDWKTWDFLYVVTSKKEGCSTDWILPYEEAVPYFSKYDTYEIVDPIFQSRIAYEALKGKPKLRLEYAAKMIPDIKPLLNKITKGAVEVALNYCGYDEVWAKQCYLLLHERLNINIDL